MNSGALQTRFFMNAKNMDANQTAPLGFILLYCLQYKLPKDISRREEEKKVVIGSQ